jgi:hypothetical protein
MCLWAKLEPSGRKELGLEIFNSTKNIFNKFAIYVVEENVFEKKRRDAREKY